MANFTVVYDASVLYPTPLRDLLMHLAGTDLFPARWTDEIHDEWIRSVLADRPDLTRERLERTRVLMDAAVPDCLITGYEVLIPGLALPDLDDRHVLAAAIQAGADVIVSANLRDFPAESLARYEMQAMHPDEFVRYLIDLAPDLVCLAVRCHRASLKKPSKSVDGWLDTLRRQGLTVSVELLRQSADRI